MLDLRALRALVVLSSVLAPGCGGVATLGALIAQPIAAVLPDKPPPFEDAVTAFNNDLRWGRIHQAVAQVDREQQARFLELFEDEAAPFQFTSIDVVTTTPTKFTIDGDGEPAEVEALVSYEFYKPPMVTQEKIRQHQRWRFVLAERRWVLDFDFEPFDARERGAAPAAAAPPE
jgi:hypothetical protein